MDPLKPLLAAGVTMLIAAPSADAQAKYLVTFAARSCPEYTDVFANLARNDIQESLRDLGPDTPYVAGEPITPVKEEPGQPNCTPLPNWRFVLGQGYESRAVSGTWGSLSKVTSPYDTSIVTKDSTPALDRNGNSTGFNLRGAVTVELTDDEAQRASANQSLWLQGGAVDDPVLDKIYPGGYGFAALRCAIDNLNGDNVETISFPQGTRHVYCYAYYVTPPPTSGTIIVRKVVDDPSVTTKQQFTYGGNISYSSDHTFSLSAANGQDASVSFIRAAVGASDPPWTFQEQVPAGWTLTGLSCTSATGTSTSTTTPSTGAASVTLAAGDTVTCTYTNRQQPPPAGLLLSKRTLGGVGSFAFRISGTQSASQTISTTAPDVAVTGAPLQGPAGAYTIRETTPPRGLDGHWIPTAVTCGGRAFDPLEPVRLTVSAGAGVACEFTNRFIPAGAITVRKVTLGATGTAFFQITPVRDPAQPYSKSATTSRQFVPVTARGDNTTSVPLGTYTITETGRRTKVRGYWTLDAVVCDGRPVASAAGTARIRLTTANPKADCTFINQFVDRPLPPRPPFPGPTPTPTPSPSPVPTVSPAPTPTPTVSPDIDGPTADLVVTKKASPARTAPGEPVKYTITVTNRGPNIAYDVAAAELRPARTTALKLRASQGSCSGRRPARCRIGTLDPGESATITATAPAGAPGRITNRVGVVTSVGDPDLTNNVGEATVTVRRRVNPRFTG